MDELYEKLESWVEKQKYTFVMGEWFKGKSTKAITTDKLADLVPPTIKDSYLPKDIKEQLNQVSIALEADDSDNDEDHPDTELYVRDFLVKYKDLLLSKWSEVDETVYEGLKYTINNDAPLILAPTGNGKEYVMIGRTYMDVYTALSGLKVKDSNINRLKYIENCIIHELLSVCFAGSPQHPDVINASRLSACVLDSMYGKKPVFDGPNIVGYCFQYLGGKPNALKYMEKSLETFLADSNNYIENVAPISNDPEVETFRYVSLDFVDGDWSAYKKWFTDTFENPYVVAKAFMCHIAAFLDAGNRGKQCMWIRGYGDDAKSTVFNAISDYLGSAASPIDIKLLKDNAHGWSQFDNVRLGIISDAKRPASIGDDWLHKITGNDTYLSNEKFKTPRKTTAITKLVFLENIDPIVKVNQDNHMSRIVYYKCKLKSVQDKINAGIGILDSDGVFHKTGNEIFADAIREQTPAFLNACMKLYWSESTLCPTRSQIIVPSHMVDDLVTVCSDESEDILEYELEKAVIKGVSTDSISRSELHDLIKSAYGGNWHPIVSPQTIKLLLEKNYGSVVKQVRGSDDIRVRAYTGVKLKNTSNVSFTATKQPSALDMIASIKEKSQIRLEIAEPAPISDDMSWAD